MSDYQKIHYRLTLVILGVVLGICWGCVVKPERKEPRVGEVMDFHKSQQDGMIMCGSSSLYNGYTVTNENIIFSVGLDKSGRVVYVSTRDPDFQTPEGVGIGEVAKKVQSLTSKQFVKETGWAYYIELPSGWNAAFVVGSTMTVHSLPSDAKAVWFFKRQ